VDFIRKPTGLGRENTLEQEQLIVSKVLLAADVEIELLRYLRPPNQYAETVSSASGSCNKVVAIGAAEGAFSTLLKMIPRLDPRQPAAYLFMLYESPEIIDSFISYLEQDTPGRIRQPLDGEKLESGICYLCSCHNYVTLDQRGGSLALKINPNPFPKRRGAINMLMTSLAERMPADTVGILLTGSGQDGVEGLLELDRVGARVIVQEPRTCLYKEMPRTANSRLKSIHKSSDIDMAATLNQFLASGDGKAPKEASAMAGPPSQQPD
jgi:two-component system chemotaxis response regulator CheB